MYIYTHTRVCVRLRVYVHDLRLPPVLTVSFLRSEPARPAGAREKGKKGKGWRRRSRGRPGRSDPGRACRFAYSPLHNPVAVIHHASAAVSAGRGASAAVHPHGASVRVVSSRAAVASKRKREKERDRHTGAMLHVRARIHTHTDTCVSGCRGCIYVKPRFRGRPVLAFARTSRFVSSPAVSKR